MPGVGGKTPAFLRRIRALCPIFVLLCPIFSHAQDAAAAAQYQLKAAFVYNFVKFVDWPPQAFADASSDYVIGIFGKNNFGDNLQEAIENKTVKGRHLRVELFKSITQIANCQLLFVSDSEKNHLVEIIAAVRDKNILTVGETEGFIAAGGMINFKRVDNYIRFQINNSAAKKCNLAVSSDLLNLAVP